MEKNLFLKAQPVWLEGRTEEIHVRALFRTVVTMNAGQAFVKIATSGIYNLYVNGCFVAYGPARAGRGKFRMDNLEVSRWVRQGENTISIEVAGYFVNSFYLIKQPSFLQAEVMQGETVCSFTGDNSFEAAQDSCVLQKVQRFSFQRPMVESYRLSPDWDAYRTSSMPMKNAVTPAVQEQKEIIARLAPYPVYEVLPAAPIGSGTIGKSSSSDPPPRDRSVTDIGPLLQGFPLEELELCVTDQIQGLTFSFDSSPKPGNQLAADEFRLYELPYNATGMLTAQVRCEQDIELFMVFDEVLWNGDIYIPRSGCANTVKFFLKKGSYRLKLFEVYTMKFIKLCVLGGSAEISQLQLIEYKHPPISYLPEIAKKDPALTKICHAALESYRQNAVDLFIDCPSRERAGWLCDSFFTGRVEKLLTGSSLLEKSFLENFLHEEHYVALPHGMFPMCYPGDHPDGGFITPWAMWLVLELVEYQTRSGDRALIDAFRHKVYELLAYLKGKENSDGLLEKLDGWVFVEWSKANELGQDVNYPTNMVYCGMLRAAAQLYNDPALLTQAQRVKQMVLQQSFDGQFFNDNAVRMDGTLVCTKERTEVCQYYAFFFDIATPETHGDLFRTLLQEFGPDRKDGHNQYPDIYYANAFIGNYLRLDVLMRYGYKKEVLENIRGYFLYMAEKTGTLWENVSDTASCNHGFASHVLYWLAQM